MTLISDPNHLSITPERIVGISRRNRLHGLLGKLADRQSQQLGPDPTFNSSIHELLRRYEGEEVVAGSAGAVALQEILRSGPRIKEPLFFPGGVSQNKGSTLLTISQDPDGVNPLLLPVSNFVFAPRFENWSQGRGQNPKNGEDSSALIRKYARKPAGTSPPLEFVSAYIQPDGLALFSVSFGSHRVGASHARGDDMVAVAGAVPVYELTQNIVPPELTTSVGN